MNRSRGQFKVGWRVRWFGYHVADLPLAVIRVVVASMAIVGFAVVWFRVSTLRE